MTLQEEKIRAFLVWVRDRYAEVDRRVDQAIKIGEDNGGQRVGLP